MRLCLHIVSFVMNAHKCNVSSSHLDNAKLHQEMEFHILDLVKYKRPANMNYILTKKG